MRLKPDTPAFTLLLAFLTMIGPLSTDIFLPSMPSMALIFATTPAAIQATLTSYFVGFALAQLLYGPISDRTGRRPILVASLVLYTATSFLCVVAPGINALIAARFLQAVAAAGPMILARTIVRDMHAGVRAGHLLAVMASIMGVVPILAPAIGGFLEAHFGWQSSFWVMTVVGVGSTALVIAALPETLGDLRADTLSVSSILRSYAIVASSPVFRAYAAFVCCGYAGLILYVGASSFIVQGRYGLSPIAYGFTFAMGAAAFIVGTYLGRVVARRTALNYAIGVGAAFLAAGGALLPLGIAFGPGNVAEFVIPVAIFMVGIGIVMPQSLAAALTPFPERAGAASSLLGFLQMSIAAIVLALTGVVLGDDALANACVLGVSGVGAGLIYLATRKARRS